MRRILLSLLATLGLIIGCGGSGNSGGQDGGCDGSCPFQHLTVEDTQKILKQAIATSRAKGVDSTFAILDRIGNVLALYQMDGAKLSTTITGQVGAVGGLEGLSVPSKFAAISKAGTGAFLSS